MSINTVLGGSHDLLPSEVTVTTEELAATLKAITQAADDDKLKRICEVMDEDHDGKISLEELTKVRGQVVSIRQPYVLRILFHFVFNMCPHLVGAFCVHEINVLERAAAGYGAKFINQKAATVNKLTA